MENKPNYVYSRDVLEFVTVATEYCVYLEQLRSIKREDFSDRLLKILPLLYLKASLLDTFDSDEMIFVEEIVSEDDYAVIQQNVLQIMGGMDDYLDVFVEEMKYSDVPVRRTISEDLADIYQDVRNFVGLYKQGNEEVMWTAITHVKENFSLYWGQTLLNAMKALHDVHYNHPDDGHLDEDL